VIINETAEKFLGFKNPLNETLYRPSGYVSNGGFASKPFHIIGVVKDFNFNSLHDKVGPLVIELSENYGRIAMRINSKNIPALISEVE
jgi:putative ABC transport system permease protein